MRGFNPDFTLGFEENGLNLCQNKACEQNAVMAKSYRHFTKILMQIQGLRLFYFGQGKI